MSGFSFLPHTDDDIASMLAEIGVERIADLFSDVPETLLQPDLSAVPEGRSETEVLARLRALSDRNTSAVSFLGAGSYDHIIPSVVPYLAARSEFATAYTPYQAEVSQGMLQAMFEFQTMIRMLTGLPVPNASLYDGATAATEACAMALQTKRKSKKLLISETIHPHTRSILETYFEDLDCEIVTIPEENGHTSLDSLEEIIDESCAGVLLQSPNVYGVVEDLTGVSDLAHGSDALLIISSNPMSLGILRNQASWGADIGVGDSQPLGLPQSFGGPSAGYIAATRDLMRKMPGRIVGETVDVREQRAFVLTMQAREQHIKRERATSNICTNQALAALTVTLYLATVGKQGFREISAQNAHKAHYLAQRLEAETALEMRLPSLPFYNEFVVTLPVTTSEFCESFAEDGMFPGIPLSDLGMKTDRELLVTVTEKRSLEEIDRYVERAKRSAT